MHVRTHTNGGGLLVVGWVQGVFFILAMCLKIINFQVKLWPRESFRKPSTVSVRPSDRNRLVVLPGNTP